VNTILSGEGIRLPHWKDALARFLEQGTLKGKAK